MAAWGEGRGRLYNRIVSSNRAAPTAAPTRMRHEGSVGLRGGKGAASTVGETLRRVQASAPTFRLLFCLRRLGPSADLLQFEPLYLSVS